MLLGTPASRRVCQEVASLSGDTILLGFSRGKDCIAAWLWLLEFFPRIIPFHCAAVPGLGFVDQSLTYYEQVFGTPIERFVSGDFYKALSQLVYQPIEDEDWIDALDLEHHTMEAIVRALRRKHGCPQAWVAWGISKNDSISRRATPEIRTGKRESTKALYPCFDWPRDQILAVIEEAGIRLPE